MRREPLQPVEVRVSGLAASFGDRHVLHDVTFTLEPGTVTAFLGRNGAGKSTTVRRIAGLLPGGGTVRFRGAHLLDHEQPHRIVGVDLGTDQAHPGRTVRDHLLLLAHDLPDPRSRVSAVLETLGIAHLAARRPRKFSTGMRRALALAGTVIADPSVLILDEPIGGLEVATVRRVKDMLRDHAARGGTVLFASHLLGEVERLADRVLILDGGRIVADEPLAGYLERHRPHETIARPDASRPFLDAVRSRGLQVRELDGDRYVVTADEREVAGCAQDADVLLLELTPQRASLEDAFLGRGER